MWREGERQVLMKSLLSHHIVWTWSTGHTQGSQFTNQCYRHGHHELVHHSRRSDSRDDDDDQGLVSRTDNQSSDVIHAKLGVK